jgi:hypothetical protein
MAERTPYQILGLAEDASFEDIKAAKEHLLTTYAADEEQQEKIEQAYDLILMQLLKMRREGKIPVPDRIRFAERSSEWEPDKILFAPADPAAKVPQWLSQWVDSPTKQEVLLSGGMFGGLAAWVVLIPSQGAPTLPLALGLLASIWLIYRKEKKAIHAILLSLGSLTAGWLIALTVADLLPTGGSVAGGWLVGITFTLMWLVVLFLR